MDVKDRIMMRLLTNIIFGISLLILGACQQEIPKGALRIDTIPLDTPLTIDGNYVGNSPARAGQYFAIELPEGEHVVTALVDVDKEKQLFIEKKIFVAPDTIQTMTLELEERLTDFGEHEKARREAEKFEQNRLAKIERKRDYETAVSYLESTIIDNRDQEGLGWTHSYQTNECIIRIRSSLKYSNGETEGDSFSVNIKEHNLSVEDGYIGFHCPNDQNCLTKKTFPKNQEFAMPQALLYYEPKKVSKNLEKNIKKAISVWKTGCDNN